MKPRWAYIWEYTHWDSGELVRTPDPLTEDELISLVGCSIADVGAKPIQETRVDRRQVPYRDSTIRRKAPMPDFKAPTTAELRALWREHPDLHLLILEIIALRDSLKKIQDWYDTTAASTDNKGDLGGPFGPLQKLRHLLRKEQERAGMM